MTKEQAKERINAVIKKAYTSMAYAAPELQQFHWEQLRLDILTIVEDIDK